MNQVLTDSVASPRALTVDRPTMDEILRGLHRDPFSVLGPHSATVSGRTGVAVRVFVPGAVEAWLIRDGQPQPMRLCDAGGFFEAWLPDAVLPIAYRLRFRSDVGGEFEIDDPYSFGSWLGDVDLHLIGEGTHNRLYDRMGAHLCEVNGVQGVSFGVWAPNAHRVSVVGDFNFWDGRRHVMRRHPSVGVWDIFIPGVQEGTCYKFEILGPGGQLLPLKADPFGFSFEVRPKTAAIVYNLDQYTWRDNEWITNRTKSLHLDEPISVYEVHLGSWMRSPENPHELLGYRELAEKLVAYVKEMGFTHIQLMPVSEHPFDGSWGYQTLGYFAPTSRYGKPADFMHFVDYCHQNGIGVFVDWVPAHFPRDDHGLRFFDGSSLYEHADPRQGEHPDWGTQVFNYGRNEVANFLIANALFWFERYHIDGVRVDAVASMLYLDYGRRSGEWIPNQYGGNENLAAVAFLKRFNEVVHQQFPGVLTIAEESTAWPGVSRPTYLGGLGFSLKWNMGWMNDTLVYMHKEAIHRKYHQYDLTFSLVYAFSENFMLPLSHDEVVHGKGALLDKMPGDDWQKFANLRLLFGFMFGHPGKKLLFMGGEFAQWREWRYAHSLDWHLCEYPPHRGMQRLVADLNRLLRHEPALFECDFDHRGFQWVDFHDCDGSIIAFLRKGKGPGDVLMFVCNFTPVVRSPYRFGVPTGGRWLEVLNTDSAIYGGGNVGNAGGVQARPVPSHGFNFSVELTVPPLATVVFKAEQSVGFR